MCAWGLLQLFFSDDGKMTPIVLFTGVQPGSLSDESLTIANRILSV